MNSASIRYVENDFGTSAISLGESPKNRIRQTAKFRERRAASLEISLQIPLSGRASAMLLNAHESPQPHIAAILHFLLPHRINPAHTA